MTQSSCATASNAQIQSARNDSCWCPVRLCRGRNRCPITASGFCGCNQLTASTTSPLKSRTAFSKILESRSERADSSRPNRPAAFRRANVRSGISTMEASSETKISLSNERHSSVLKGIPLRPNLTSSAFLAGTAVPELFHRDDPEAKPLEVIRILYRDRNIRSIIP